MSSTINHAQIAAETFTNLNAELAARRAAAVKAEMEVLFVNQARNCGFGQLKAARYVELCLEMNGNTVAAHIRLEREIPSARMGKTERDRANNEKSRREAHRLERLAAQPVKGSNAEKPLHKSGTKVAKKSGKK